MNTKQRRVLKQAFSAVIHRAEIARASIDAGGSLKGIVDKVDDLQRLLEATAASIESSIAAGEVLLDAETKRLEESRPRLRLVR